MSKQVFVDTSGWTQRFSKREGQPEEVASFVKAAASNHEGLVTNRDVVVGTITLLYIRLASTHADIATGNILDSENEGLIGTVSMAEGCFQKTLELRWTYSDKPDIPFTDLSFMAMMDERGLSDMLTGDEHFEDVGMGFRCRP